MERTVYPRESQFSQNEAENRGVSENDTAEPSDWKSWMPGTGTPTEPGAKRATDGERGGRATGEPRAAPGGVVQLLPTQEAEEDRNAGHGGFSETGPNEQERARRLTNPAAAALRVVTAQSGRWL